MYLFTMIRPNLGRTHPLSSLVKQPEREAKQSSQPTSKVKYVYKFNFSPSCASVAFFIQSTIVPICGAWALVWPSSHCELRNRIEDCLLP
jgi:hypothetical protein